MLSTSGRPERYCNDFIWPGESSPRPFPAPPYQAYMIRAANARIGRRADGSIVAKTSTDRNAPCPCGSGKKFKKCCI